MSEQGSRTATPDPSGTQQQSGPDPAAAPVLRVKSPNATAEDVAALTVLFTAMGGREGPPAPRVSNWTASARQGRRAPRPAPMAWRLSNRPT